MRSSGRIRQLRGPIFGAALFIGLASLIAPFTAQDDSDQFGGKERYLAHVSTDKPIYRPGEKAYFRTFVLHAFDHTPFKSGSGRANLKIKNSRGSTLVDSNFRMESATGGASWDIPSDVPGGEYTAEISFPSDGLPTTVRKFDIRAFRAPRIKTQLEFLKKAYGPGETVTCTMSAERAEGGVPSNALVTAVARVDGTEVWRGKTSIDDDGNCSVSFDLPASIEQGVGSITLVIEDGGVVETAGKTLPILLQQIPVVFCPEGGDLVAGLDCGLYFEATTPWGDPADIRGRIIDADGNVAAQFATEHEGRGKVRFTPKAGVEYFAEITEPAGITKLNALPAVQSKGVSLSATESCYDDAGAIAFNVAATEGGKYKLAVCQRENELVAKEIELESARGTLVTLPTETDVDGVLRVTLFDADDKPLAERLVFVRRSNPLDIQIVATPANAVPGDKVTLKIKTTLQNGEPVEAMVGLTVTDDAVLEMIEKRMQAPRLPAMVLLENEVDHLEDANIYLKVGPDSAKAVDLLLGTQGWRRFAYDDAKAFLIAHEDKAQRVLAFRRAIELQGWGDEGGGGGAIRPDGAPAPRGAVEDKKKGDNEGEPEIKDNAAHGKAGADAPEEEKDMKPVRRIVEDPARDEAGAGRARRERMRRPQLAYVREYAHALREGRKPGDRRDFTETLYWNAGVQTDEKGEAEISFYLSDSITSFRVMADGFTGKGSLGQADAIITSREPFYLEPKLPLEVTAGDKILVPVSLVNSTDGSMKVVLEAEGGEAISLPADFAGELELQADQRGRLLLPVTVRRHNGKVSLTLSGNAGTFSDRVTREITVRPMGFPISYSVGGMMDGPKGFTITVPEDVHFSTVTTSARVYPTPAANIMAAVEALIREPGG